MDKEALQQAIKACAISDVYIRRTSVEMSEEFDPTIPGIKLDLQYRISPTRREMFDIDGGEQGGFFRVHVEAGLRYLLKESGDESDSSTQEEASVVAEIEAMFVARYEIVGNKPSNECLDEFAKVNAPYHIWPYWREYAQSLCMRHKLPHVILPMLTLDMIEAGSEQA